MKSGLDPIQPNDYTLSLSARIERIEFLVRCLDEELSLLKRENMAHDGKPDDCLATSSNTPALESETLHSAIHIEQEVSLVDYGIEASVIEPIDEGDNREIEPCKRPVEESMEVVLPDSPKQSSICEDIRELPSVIELPDRIESALVLLDLEKTLPKPQLPIMNGRSVTLVLLGLAYIVLLN